MIFYNVIYAILFYGSFVTLLNSIATNDFTTIWCSSIVLLIILNDLIIALEFVESDPGKNYTTNMKQIDFINFILLSFSWVAISPGQNFFQVNLSNIIPTQSLTLFWSLLLIYWILGMIWNFLGKIVEKGIYTKTLKYLSFIPLFYFLMMLIFDWNTPVTIFIIFILLLVQLMIIKPIFIYKKI